MATNTNNNTIVINQNELGGGVVTNGVFGAESLTPMGTFPNLPQYYQYSASKNSTDKLTLTLQKVKDALRKQLDAENGTTFTNSAKDDELVESYLFEFVSLLVDYTDLRNFIFYGSAYTELAHNIQYIVTNFPYKFLISTLTTSLNTINAEFTFTDDVSTGETTFLIQQSAIKDGIEEFNFYDNNLDFNWLDYDLVDSNGTRYPVKKVITPYSSGSIFNITNISNQLVTPTMGLPYTTLKIQTVTNHNYFAGQTINIVENTLLNTITGKNDATLDDNYIISQVTSPTEFLIVSKYALSKIQSGSDDLSDQAVSIPLNHTVSNFGLTRLIPLSQNLRPYTIKMVVEGNISDAQLTSYIDKQNNDLTGFILSKKQNIISDWEFNLSPIQRTLLAPAPVNPTPWPTRIVTQNIQHLLTDSTFNTAEQQFVQWLQSPTNMYVPDGTDADSDLAFSDTYTEYRLARALALDETQTNQLVRRCIPQDLISELNDTPDGRFQRFILIAGWFFDQIRLYVKFIKFVHHLDYSNFNQLSPQYYKYYANYYGFDLFSDDGTDFSQLVVKTEPGFYFIQNSSSVVDPNSKYYKLTQQQLAYERQKRLLLSLFYLYKTKGTPGAIKKLVGLLGAPDGFLVFNEYAFDIQPTDQFDYFGTGASGQFNFKGKRTVNNDKISTPGFHWEIDPNYPVADTSQPPVYRMRLDNESQYNLRMASVLTNPNGAVDSQIVSLFGTQKYNYGILKNGEFANLQSINNYGFNKPYYGLPLTLPDKFSGMTVEYMIPRNGFNKGVGNNLDEVSVHICSLYQLPASTVPNTINNIYSYTLPEVFSNFDYSSVRSFSGDTTAFTDDTPNIASDFAGLSRLFFDTNNISITQPYVICRLEGKDLVVRARLQKETGAGTDIGERVAIVQNVFEADGLNHTLRLVFTPIGVEVFEDYSHLGINNQGRIGIAEWLDPTTSGDGMPYCAFEIPKSKILTCTPLIYDGSVFFAYPDNTGTDTPQYWDLFIGFPSNVDFYFKRVAVEENYAIDAFDINDKITNPLNYTSQFYSFDFTDNDGDNTNFSIRATYEGIEPNIANAVQTVLPVEQFDNKVVVKDLKLTPKTFLVDVAGNSVNQVRYFTRTQDFFNVSDPFADNAHSQTLHKDYYYDNFHGKLTKLYALYSPQVLTYELLQSFLNLIESNFKKVITSFIPIVIDISEFGRLIANSKFYQEKVHYANIEKKCQGIYIGDKAVLEVRIYEAGSGIVRGNNLTINFKNQDTTNLIPQFTVNWAGTSELTLGQLLLALGSSTVNTVYPKLQVQLTDDLLIVTIDTNWYATTYGMDVNQVIMTTSDGTHLLTSHFSHGIVGGTITDCGFVKYSPPFRSQAGVYVYYGSENQPPRYVYYDSEGKPPTYLDF